MIQDVVSILSNWWDENDGLVSGWGRDQTPHSRAVPSFVRLDQRRSWSLSVGFPPVLDTPLLFGVTALYIPSDTMAFRLRPNIFAAIRPTAAVRRFATDSRLTPDHVRIVEVGPRDGLQNEKKTIPLETKLQLIEKLANTGLTTIEAGSFVSPKWVPQVWHRSPQFSNSPA